jgi:hypothetical protein
LVLFISYNEQNPVITNKNWKNTQINSIISSITTSINKIINKFNQTS